MILYSVSFFLGGCLVIEIAPSVLAFFNSTFLRREEKAEKRALYLVSQLLLDFEEKLKSGHALSENDFARLEKLASGWRELISQSLRLLRERGASVIPTLERLRAQAEFQLRLLETADSKSAVGLMQAQFCILLGPALGCLFYSLLPELEKQSELWWFGVGVSTLVTGFGSAWMLRLVSQAKSGGVQDPALVKEVLLGLERWMALIRSGQSADIAWTQASLGMQNRSHTAFLFWGSSVWNDEENALENRVSKEAGLSKKIRDSLSGLRRGIAASIVEGRSILERAESNVQSLELEIEAAIQKAVEKLSVNVLKPLMVCVAPSVLGLFSWAMFLSIPSDF